MKKVILILTILLVGTHAEVTNFSGKCGQHVQYHNIQKEINLTKRKYNLRLGYEKDLLIAKIDLLTEKNKYEIKILKNIIAYNETKLSKFKSFDKYIKLLDNLNSKLTALERDIYDCVSNSLKKENIEELLQNDYKE